MRNNQEAILKFQTPFYLFDEAECVNRAMTIKQEVREWGGRTCFAIKANPFLIPVLLPIVDKFEVCSPGELEICRKYRVPGEKILFSGVVKSKTDIETAIDYPVNVITLESMQHWKLLKEVLREHSDAGKNTHVRIMPRLSSGAQFGMEKSEICEILEECRKSESITVAGIHYFTGTQKKGRQYEKELDLALAFIQELQDAYTLKNMILEYGPGLAVPYFTGDDHEDPYVLIRNLKAYILQKSADCRIDIELGRYMAASCGRYVTEIVDIKHAQDRNYCLVDGGIHQVNYYGSNMAMRTPVIAHIRRENTEGSMVMGNARTEENGSGQEYMICGSLCTFADILARGVALDQPQIGDRLVFENIGAYSVTEGSYLFLSHPLPALYLQKQSGEIELLRDKIESYRMNSKDE